MALSIVTVARFSAKKGRDSAAAQCSVIAVSGSPRFMGICGISLGILALYHPAELFAEQYNIHPYDPVASYPVSGFWSFDRRFRCKGMR